MRGILASAFALILGCGLAFGQGGENAAPGSKTTPTMERSYHKHTGKFHGTVESVDATNHKISVMGKSGKSMDFSLGNETTIRKGRQNVNLSDIATGDRVTVTYTGSRENPQATSILLKSKKK